MQAGLGSYFTAALHSCRTVYCLGLASAAHPLLFVTFFSPFLVLLIAPVQAGLGSIFLGRSLLVNDSLLLEPRLSSTSALAAAAAVQYFGLLLLPRGPEDDWLMRGLAGWLEGQGLKTVAGNNELQYKRWQVCMVQAPALVVPMPGIPAFQARSLLLPMLLVGPH